MPQDKGQVEEIAVRAVKTKIMPWITSLRSVMTWTEFLVAFWIRKEESLTSMEKKTEKRVLHETEVKERDTRNKNLTRLFFVMVELNFKVWAYTTS